MPDLTHYAVVENGQGRHVKDLLVEQGTVRFLATSEKLSTTVRYVKHVVSLNDFLRLVQYAHPLSDLWAIAVTCIRISILELYITIFNQSRIFKYLCRGIMVVQLMGFIIEMVLYNIFKPTDPQAIPSYIAIHSLFLSLDLSIAILPMPMIWRLQMRTVAKIQISLLFGLGACVCICSALRIAWVNEIQSQDFTYATTMPYFFTLMEPFLGITLANLPLIQPLVRQLNESQVWQRIRTTLSPTSRSRSRATSSKGSSRSGGINGVNVDRLHGQRKLGPNGFASDQESVIELRNDFASMDYDVVAKPRDSGAYTSPIAGQKPNHIAVTKTWGVQHDV
ncbi:MAG: hypothetical protein Q9227_004897 [Pyrenula ochraceoflavens]